MHTARFNIAHVLPWSGLGGVELATLRIAELVKTDFNNIAFCLEGSARVGELFAERGFDTATYKGVEPSYRSPKDFLLASLSLAREFKRLKIDLVHCSDLLAAYYAGFAGRLARVPVLCHVRCRFNELSRRDQSFLRTVNKFVFVSHDAWRNFAYRVPPQRGIVVYDGIEVSDEGVRESETAASVRSEFGIPTDAKVIGMVARVAPAKDYATLAKAAARVVAHNQNVRFLIVGDHSHVENNRKHYKEVKQMLADRGVTPYFIFTDHRDDVGRMIGAMDIFVLSTHSEGLPLVILEAMAQAKPVVATAVGGIPEIIKDGETGLLHAHEDDAQLAAQLLSLLQDEKRASDLGEAGRQLVKKNFTKEKFAAEMIELYLDMLGCKRQAAMEIHSFDHPPKQFEGN